jgi:Glycosyltransferase Family 4
MRIAVLEHDALGASEPLLTALRRHDANPDPIRPASVPDALLRLRKIGDAPGLMPGTFVALARGDYDIAHAFTAQDAAVAVAWSRLSGRPAVYTQREPLARANVADRRLRLAMLRVAVERSAAVVAPDETTADSLRRWMAVEPRVLSPDSGAEHLRLYSQLGRR